MFWSISSSVKLQNSTMKSAYFQQKTGEKCLPWCLTSGTREELCGRNKELSFCVCINTKSRPSSCLRLILKQLNCFQRIQRILQGPLPLSLLLFLHCWRLHPAQGHVVLVPRWMLHGTMVHRDPSPDLRAVQRQLCEDQMVSLKTAEEQHWVRGSGGKGEDSHKSAVGCTTSVLH